MNVRVSCPKFVHWILERLLGNLVDRIDTEWRPLLLILGRALALYRPEDKDLSQCCATLGCGELWLTVLKASVIVEFF